MIPAKSYSSPCWKGLVRSALLVCALGAIPLAGSHKALAKEKVHTVYSGQRLGSIAKRYNVTVDELCAANGITRKDPIHPGQKLIIPDKNSKNKSSASKKSTKKSAKKVSTNEVRFHTVAKGHTLGAIAGRYAITVTALCTANGINRNKRLSVGEKLIIPPKSDRDGSQTASLREAGKVNAKTGLKPDAEKTTSANVAKKSSKSWEKYVKPAWKRGYISIRRYGRSWKGYVIGPGNKVLPLASKKINYVLGAEKDGPSIHPRLVRLLAHVSDTFGGRELRIVSGYRTKSWVAASKHKQGRALDFSIPGVPNEALRDYLRTIENVGVGYYPNSSFVHLDVRDYNAYWVDYAGPGEKPKHKPDSSKKAAGKKSNKAAEKAPAATAD